MLNKNRQNIYTKLNHKLDILENVIQSHCDFANYFISLQTPWTISEREIGRITLMKEKWHLT